jgi:hypothetical protein
MRISRGELVRALAALGLEDFQEVVSMAKRSKESAVRNSFGMGDRVVFTSRRGFDVHGIVTDILPRNVKVLADDRRAWRVNPMFLRPE